MKTSKHIIALVFTVWCAVGNLYAVTSDDYSSVNGKSGADLFNAVHSVAKTGYTSGLSYDGLWTVYCSIDLNSSGKVWDMYSNATSYTCGGSAEGANYSKEGDSYNREHSIPKSWFGGSKSANTPGTDLFHVVPTDGYVNNMRSAYAFGEVSSASYTSQSGCKKGTPKSITISNSILNKSGSSTQSCTASTVFEPMDEFKGDFARGYFGTMIKWANGDYQKFTTAEGAQIFNTAYDAAHYYGLTGYGVALLLKWHREDPVSQKEIDRNNGIQTNQGNRNPFIDYPELVEYIWGEHSGETVTLSSLTPTFSGYTPPAATTYTVILSRNGVTEAVSGLSGEYTLPATSADACTGWTFAGWSATKVTNASSAPTYVTKVSAAGTVYAVYSKTTGGSAPHRAKMAETAVTFTPGTETGATSVTKSNVTCTMTTMNNGSYYQIYANQSGTFSCSAGNITKIEFTCTASGTSKYGPGNASADVGTYSYSGTKGTWTGSAESVTISSTAQVRMSSLTVTYSGGDTPTPSITYDSEPEDCKCSGKLGTPNVTATPSDGTITLTWQDVTGATNGYTVTISKGSGYTTECGETSIGEITHSGTTNTCVISGLVNGLAYTTNVVANETASTCTSDADADTTTPVGCESWDVAFSYSTYTIATGDAALAPSILGLTHGAATFESSNPAVLQVDEYGNVTPIGAGTATVTARWAGADGYCPKEMTSSQFTVTGTLTITYDKNDGTATPATTTQVVDYNESVALDANTFTRIGYTFLGWNTDKDATTQLYTDGASYTFTEATTLYAIWEVNKYQVSFMPSPAGATVKVNNSSSTPVSNVAYNSTVTIAITPAAHYTIDDVTAGGASGSVTINGSGNTRTFTMPAEDVTVTVNMVEDPKYTVNWYVNNVPTAEQNYAGSALAGIAAPSIDCNGKTFQGWTATANYSSDDTAPTDLFTDATTKTMPSNNNTEYYAVFAEETSTVTPVANTWMRITDVSQITDGATVMLVQYYSDYAINNTPGATSCTANAEITNTNTALRWTAVKSGSKWKFKTSANKYLSTSSLDNNTTLTLDATYDEWSITADDGGGTGSNNTYTNTNCFRLNNGSDLEYYSGTFKLYAWSIKYSSAYPFYIYIQKTTGSTTYTGYTTSCTTPTEVTVSFNANGGEGTMADQNVSYNTPTALTANSFTRTGYEFAGWATSASGTKAYDDEESVTLTKNATLYALWSKKSYNVNFSTPTGASAVTVNSSSTSPQSAEFESLVTVAVTPEVTHTVGSVTVSGSVVVTNNGDNTYSFNMPANDVTVTVTMTEKPVYTIRFYDSGALLKEQSVISGQAASAPSNPSGCEGYAFVGWWTETLASTNTTAHTWKTDFTAIGNQDYYAVFAHADGGSGSSSTVSYTASAQSYGNASVPSNKTISGVTFAYGKGDGSNDPKYYDSGTSVRMYADNTLTISASSNISAITFTFGGTTTAGLTASVGTYSSGSWSGSVSSITFTAGGSGQQHIQGISVTVGGGGTTYYTTTSECCPNKPTLEFTAPTVNKFDGDDPFINPLTVTGNDLNVALKFTSSNENKASVDPSTGQVTIKDAMSDTPITITATLDATKVSGDCQAMATASYTLNIYNKVTWSVNGVAHTEGVPTTQTTEGGTITAYPEDPDGSTVCGGKTFMGWTTAEYDENDNPPTTLYTSLSSMSGVHISQNKTFYAVFAEESTSGSGSGQYELVSSVSSDLSGSYLLSDGTHTATGYLSSTLASIDITPGSTRYQDYEFTIAKGTGDYASYYSVTDASNKVISGKSSGTDLVTNGTGYLMYWSISTSSIANASTGRHIGYNNTSAFKAYASSNISTNAPALLYKWTGGSGSSTTYTGYTTTCGPNIRAVAVERLTSTKSQTVKSQALTVKGGSLSGSTLTASITGTDAAQFTCALAATTITAGAIETTYTISYTPTVFGATHEATLTFTDGTTSSESITLRGRSLPEQFAIVAYDGSKYYVLDGTMSGDAKVVRPIEVTVSGGEVTMCPARAVYSLTQLDTPDQNVYLVSNDKRLWGGSSGTGLNMKSLTSTSGTNWLLTTSDFVTYHITNATNTGRGVMYSGANNVFGHYATSNYGTANYYGDLRMMPIGTICTCLDAPVATATPRSTSATISWSAVANAIRYDVTCSGGSVSVSGTTATITGLSSNTTYTYSVKAVASGADCSLSYNDSFTTTTCDDVPQDVRVTPNVKEAIIRWTAEAEQAKVILYSDAECTTPVKTIDPAVSPCTVEDLAEDARYYVKVFGGSDKNCESAVVSFSTLTTAVEIVEWLTDGVKILLTGDDQTASIYIEDKQENAGGTSTKVAEDIFFSKYFEASGFTKLVGLYNGTDHSIDISDLIIKGGQNGWTESKGTNNYIAVGDISKLQSDYGDGDKIMLPKNTEIILYTLRDENKSDYTGEGCVDGFYNWDQLAANTVDNWYRIGTTNKSTPLIDDDGHNQLNFSGPYSIGLFRGTELIDIIGAGTASRPYDTNTVQKSKSTDPELFPFTLGNGRVIEKANDKEGFFCADGMAPPSEEYPEGYTTYLSTNLCFLMRKNDVVSGANAVDKNKADFVTLCDEWLGVPIGNDLSSAEKSCLSGGQFGYVGSYDYQGYYAQFDSVTTITELENHKNDDGTITIPVDRLDTLSCSKLRITVYEGGVEKASKEYQVPIMIASGTKVTTDELFTKHNAETCASCDVVVFNGATLQKGEAASGRNAIHDLTLYPGSTLDLPSGKGDYSVNSVTYRVEGDNVPVTKLNGDLLTESKKLIVTRRITNDRYYFISLPYNCNMADIQLSNGTPATNGLDFRLLEYDAETRAQEGSLQGAPGHWKLATGDVLEAGKGYAIAVSSKKPKEIVFPMTLPSSNLTYEERTKVTNTVDINEYVGAARSTNYNWNLIAHPYITKFEVTSGAANVEAYWEEPHRYNTDWIDDWKTWPEEDPTQGTDSTETHTGEIVESGTTEGGIVWVLYADGSIELTGAGQMSDFTSLDAVPWAQHRQLIQNVKIGGDVQKIGKYAFGQCTNLTNVIIAAPVTNLASQAFAGCTGLRTFRIESTQYVSATTTTFDGISSLTMISLYVPQSMYSQYSAQTPWSKMAISAFDDNSTTGGQTSGDGTNTTNPSPRRAPVHDGWTVSPGGIYVTIPVFRGGKVDYDQYWINEVADIKPFTAVFIQGDGQGEMTFNMYPSSPAPKRMLQAAPCETRDHTVFVGLTINGNGQKDKTSLRLRPDFTEEYKFNLDLLKFTVFNTARPQIYFKTPNEQLAFRAVSDSLAANTWLPVGVYCRDAGEYTFSLHDRYVWDEVEAVYLRDNVTGVETNLLIGNYTITTTGQIYTNTRFAVKVLLRRKQVVETPTMIDHTEDPNAPRKFFRDGLLYILRDGKVYDMTGKPVEFDDLLNR